MPVVAGIVPEGASMACPPCKSAQLHAEGIGLRGKWPQGVVAYQHSVGIATEFGSRGSILQVIFPLVFGHVGAFHERIEESIVHVFAKPLPAIAPGFQEVHLLTGAHRIHGFPVKFDAIHGIPVAAAIVHIEFAIVVGEKVGVPAANFKTVNQRFPFVGSGIGTHPNGKFTRVSRPENQHRVADDAHRRGAQFVIHPGIPGAQEFARMEFPVEHVAARPVTPLVGTEKVIFALVVDNHRIGGGPVPSPCTEVGDGRIAIVDVDGVAIGLLFCFLRFGLICKKQGQEEYWQQNG